MTLSNDFASRWLRLVFTVAMAWCWVGGLQSSVARAADTGSAGQRPYFDMIQTIQRDIPRESFDVAAVARLIGADPAAAVAWVKEHTAWVPYEGSLRGPVGVLMDRRGNSLDRATLLAELVRANGTAVRLARAALSDEQVKALAAKQSYVPKTPLAAEKPADKAEVDATVDRLAAASGVDAAALRTAGNGLLVQSQRTTEDLVSRTAVQSETLAKLIGPISGDAAVVDVAKALADHWWVQANVAGQWIDLDVASISPTPTPLETIDWQPTDGHWPIDAARCHEVQVRVVIETFDNGKTTEQIALAQNLRPSELIGTHIALQHSPIGWPAELNLLAEADPAAKVKTLAMDQHEWLPVLRVGSQVFYQGSFTDAGQLTPNATLDAMKKTGKSIGTAAASALDALTADPPAAAATPTGTGQVTAEWLEFDLHTPGQPNRVIRRQVFDLLGPAARAKAETTAAFTITDSARLERSLSLLGQVELLPLVGDLSTAFVNDLSARNALATQPLLGDVADTNDAAVLADKMTAMQNFAPMPGVLYDLALARQSTNAHPADTYLDRLNLFSLHTLLHDDPAKGILTVHAIDIVASDVAARPDLSPALAATRKLEAGVRVTNAESLLLGSEGKVATIADQLASMPTPDTWRVVRSASDPAWKDLPIPADLRAAVDADLVAGYTAIVPVVLTDMSSAGWWRVDPRSGQILGMNGRGWGAAMVEYAGMGLLFFNACMVGAAAVGKFGPNAPSNGKTAILCALGGIGFGAGAAAGATAVGLKLAIAAAATGGAAGGAF